MQSALALALDTPVGALRLEEQVAAGLVGRDRGRRPVALDTGARGTADDLEAVTRGGGSSLKM